MKQKFNRRRALQYGLAGTMGAVRPRLFHAPHWLQTSGPRPTTAWRSQSSAAGAGQTYFHSPVPRAQVVATCDVNLPRAQRAAQAHGCQDVFQDYRRLLERKDVEAVMIATPDHWHAAIAIAACQAGKHVYVDKPMTMCVVEGRRMVEAARKYGRTVQVGSQQRSTVPNRDGCALIHAGGIGHVKRALTANLPSAWFCDYPGQSVPDGLDWDMWCGPSRLLPYHENLYACEGLPGWMNCRDYGVGTTGNWGGHGIDQVQWALGTDATGPVEVLVNGAALVPPVYTNPESPERGAGICSSPLISFRYASGTMLELGGGSISGAIFEGEKGKVEIRRGSVHSNPADLIENVQLPDGPSYTQAHINNWLDCIASKELPVADVEIGHRTATICHLANIGRVLGRNLRWDPTAERFIGDDEANGLLERERRKGYELPETI